MPPNQIQTVEMILRNGWSQVHLHQHMRLGEKGVDAQAAVPKTSHDMTSNPYFFNLKAV